MKEILFTTFILLNMTCGYGQLTQDPKAKEVLDEVAEITEKYETIQAEFTLKYVNRREDINTENEGTIHIRDSSYILETLGSKVIYDGENMYTIMEDLNEITITRPNMEDEDFVSNPAKIFTWYERDFKYRYKSTSTLNGQQYHEIELYPKNLDQPYSRINILVNADNYHLYKIESVGKDGDDYLVTIDVFKTNVSVSESYFQFDKNNYPNAEIIDMRF
ncbi:MAG: outer membrane lipoprotein-sorting protein [Bacteroidetes bacterium]|jgi:outer membrane lipoprotein-sorting protein|nr:outer membrane lipoprotein-sorting protein [Bacteroidota bacterium]